jgi:hypothetical protein
MTDNNINVVLPGTTQTAQKRKTIYILKDEARKIYIPSQDCPINYPVRENTIHQALQLGNEDQDDNYDPDLEVEEVFEFEDDMMFDELNLVDEEDGERLSDIEFQQEEFEEIFRDGFVLNLKRSNLSTFHIPSDPVYENAGMTMRSLCRYLLCMKSAISVGDYSFCTIVGSLISFLPRDNLFITLLEKNSSTFKLMNIIYYFAELGDNLKTYKFFICDSGSCILKNDMSLRCEHGIKKNNVFYYMPIRQRMEYLLKSDLKNLFLYPIFKNRSEKVFCCFEMLRNVSFLYQYNYSSNDIIIFLLIIRMVLSMMFWILQCTESYMIVFLLGDTPYLFNCVGMAPRLQNL